MYCSVLMFFNYVLCILYLILDSRFHVRYEILVIKVAESVFYFLVHVFAACYRFRLHAAWRHGGVVACVLCVGTELLGGFVQSS